MKINDEAAATDISRIRQAQQKLNESMESLSKMRNVVSTMNGNTGYSIDVKASQLIKMINDLNDNLSFSARRIQQTVNKYHEEDQLQAANIRNGSGV